MQYVRRNLSLYLTNRVNAYLIAPGILLIVAVLTVVLGLIIGIRVGLPLPPEIIEGFHHNTAVFWAMAGFLVSFGALTANRGLAGALAFGSTRKHFLEGTCLGFVVTSLVLVGVGLLLLVLEATTGYGVGVKFLTIAAMDNGNPLVVALNLFMLSLVSLFTGMSFGDVYRAAGPLWTAAAVIAVVLVVLALVAAAVAWPAGVTALTDAVGRWALPMALAACALLAAVVSRTVVRFAEV